MKWNKFSYVFFSLFTTVWLVQTSWGAVVPATVVVKIGDIPTGTSGDPVTQINSPFTNGQGSLGFVGAVTRTGGQDNFVWYKDSPIWFNSNTAGLSGGENYMGVGNEGKYIYSPSYDGSDSVWTQDGLLLQEDTTSPGIPGMFVSFNSRPSMLPNGTVYWVSGWTDIVEGSTLGRILYRSADTITPVTSIVFKSGDYIGGFTIASPSGIDFDYMISDNDLHHIHVIMMETGSSANDGFVYVDGSLIAREASPANGGGSGENWDNFDLVSINNDGNYSFSGDTDGSTLADEFIAYNGEIALREGQVIDGVTLNSPSYVDGLAINNRNQAVYIWRVSDVGEYLFFARNASKLSASVKVLSTDDTIDVNGDGVGDYTVTNFEATSGTRYNAWLAEDGYLFIKLEIDAGSGPVKAIVRIALPAGKGNPALPLLLLSD